MSVCDVTGGGLRVVLAFPGHLPSVTVTMEDEGSSAAALILQTEPLLGLAFSWQLLYHLKNVLLSYLYSSLLLILGGYTF